jgi:hypothetical protein
MVPWDSALLYFDLSISLSLSHSTKLERDDTEDFRQRQARAAKIAQEIEKKGLVVDDAGTEEELYEPSSAMVGSSLYLPSLPLSPLPSCFLSFSLSPLSLTDSVQ